MTTAAVPRRLDFFNPLQFGARGDGLTLDTPALQQAVDACAQDGGGTVFVSAGRYLTGSLFLRDHVSLYLDAGAVLLGSTDPADYPITSNRWEGMEQLTHSPLIAGNELKHIAVAGRGTIDGQGAQFRPPTRGSSLRCSARRSPRRREPAARCPPRNTAPSCS